MSQIVVVTLSRPASDYIANEPTAQIQLQSAADEAFTTPADVVEASLVSGTDRYELYDASGASDTWYRFRVETSADVALTDWSDATQVRASQNITNLGIVKARLGVTDADDDDVLNDIIGFVNQQVITDLGYFPGPSSDTIRTYQGRLAVKDGKRLWLHGGVRSVSLLEIADRTNGTFTSSPATDWVLGPEAFERQPGEPYHYIELVDYITGTYSRFADGQNDVRITGSFGWEHVPDELVQWATTQVVRVWKARAAGDSDIIGSDEFGNSVISYKFPVEMRRSLKRYKMPGIPRLLG